MRKLRWPLIAILASSGFLFAGATIMGWLRGWEHWVLLVIVVGIGKMAAFFAPDAPKRNAFVAGFLMVTFGVWTQGLFLSTYFENNPGYGDIEIPFGLTAQVWTLLSAPIGGIFAGAFSAASAMVFSALINRTRRLS